MMAAPTHISRTCGLLVAEGLTLVREGLAGLLAGWPHGAVRLAGTPEEAMRRLEEDPACLLLLDAGLAGPEAFRDRFPGLRIVVMAPGEPRDAVLQALAAGAHGFVSKAAGFAALARAIEVVRGGGVHVPVVAVASAPVTAPVSPLTGRQREVLRLLAEGRSTKDIARTLDLAVSTIKVHLAAVYRTFGARNRVEALCRAGALPVQRIVLS